jgi:hypothetical protein
MNGLRVLLLGALVPLIATAGARVGTLVQQAPPRAKARSNPFEAPERSCLPASVRLATARTAKAWGRPLR